MRHNSTTKQHQAPPPPARYLNERRLNNESIRKIPRSGCRRTAALARNLRAAFKRNARGLRFRIYEQQEDILQAVKNRNG